MYHSFLIHSSVDGHLGCFHVLAIANGQRKEGLCEESLPKKVIDECQTKCLIASAARSGVICHLVGDSFV